MSTPSVSVLMSVYNGAPFLDAAIDSIRAQSFDDFEFIIIDDGSTDATPAILARHAVADPRIRILSQRNLGLIAALNRGLAEASGVYVARMDADDIAKPHRLERQIGMLDSDRRLVLVGSRYEVIDAQGAVLRPGDVPTDPARIRETLDRTNCIAHPTVLMRRDAVLAAGGYRRAYLLCEDYDLWLRLAEAGDLLNLPDRLLSYRHYPGKLVWKRLEQQVLSELAARAAARRRRAGLDDPTGAIDLITRDVLRSLDVGEREIGFEITRRALQTARRSRAAGDPESAATAIDLARGQPRTSLYDAAYYWLMRAKVYL
ncbi:MAG: glycosyltransferase [Pseudomonadota bacterium]|nr:glycosyltransferase [Pseudomonadota bacterium]